MTLLSESRTQANTASEHLSDHLQIHEKLNGYIDPTADYSVVADGTTDDTATLKAALEAASPGGVVVLPMGSTTRCLSEVQVRGLTDVTIIGDGATIKAATGSADGLMLFENCSGLKFIGVTFDGGNPPPYQQGVFGNTGITLADSTGKTTFRDCSFKNFFHTCIIDATERDTTGAEPASLKNARTIVTNCRFEDAAEIYNSKPGGSRGLIFANNTLKGIYGPVKIDGEMNQASPDYATAGVVLITNNTWTDCTGDASVELSCISIEERVADIIIADNIFKSVTDMSGVRILPGQTNKLVQNLKIRGNEFSDFRVTTLNDTKFYPIMCRNTSSGGAVFSDFEIDGNTFDSTGGSCIYVTFDANAGDLKGLSITNNKFKEWLTVGQATSIRDCIYLNLLNNFSEVNVSGNEFSRRLSQIATGYRHLHVIADAAKTQGTFAIKGNAFVGTDGNSQIGVTLEYLNDVHSEGNTFEQEQFHLRSTTTVIQGHKHKNGYLSLRSDGASTVYSVGNFWSKGGGTNNFGVRVDGGGAYYEEANGYLGYSGDPVFVVSGTTGALP